MRRFFLLAAFLVTGAALLSTPEPVRADAQREAVMARSRLHLATQLQRDRRFEEALELYREIYESNPLDVRALRGVKVCLLELKQYDDLARILREQLERNPSDPAALSELGTLHARRGERPAALRVWRRILEVQGGSRGAYVSVADLLKRNRMLDEALSVYAEADSLHPGQFTRQKAELHELRFDFAAATSEYLRLLHANPTQLSYVEGRLLRIGENEDGLRPVIERVERWMLEQRAGPGAAGPGTASAAASDLVFRKLIGDLHLEAGNHDLAEEHYLRLAEETPTQFSSLLVFGKRCQTDGEHEVAIRVFEQIVSRFADARNVPSALTEIARSRAELGQWDEALASYERLIEEYPETDWALAARLESGRIQREGLGDPDAAEEIFRELIRLNGGPWGEAEPQLQVAECAVWRGDLEMARGIYLAVRERPYSPGTRERALYEEARALFHQGELAVADSLFKEVAQRYPKGLHVNDALEFSILINTNEGEDPALAKYAEALMSLRTLNPEAAVKTLDEVVASHPDDPIVDESLLLLGRAHRDAGRPDRALEVLLRAVDEAQVMDLAASARLLRAEILAEDKMDRTAALAEYEELLVAYPETLAADRARDLSGALKRVFP